MATGDDEQRYRVRTEVSFTNQRGDRVRLGPKTEIAGGHLVDTVIAEGDIHPEDLASFLRRECLVPIGATDDETEIKARLRFQAHAGAAFRRAALFAALGDEDDDPAAELRALIAEYDNARLAAEYLRGLLAEVEAAETTLRARGAGTPRVRDHCVRLHRALRDAASAAWAAGYRPAAYDRGDVDARRRLALAAAEEALAIRNDGRDRALDRAASCLATRIAPLDPAFKGASMLGREPPRGSLVELCRGALEERTIRPEGVVANLVVRCEERGHVLGFSEAERAQKYGEDGKSRTSRRIKRALGRLRPTKATKKSTG